MSRAHVGRGDVGVGADDVMNAIDEGARKSFELLARKMARINAHASLRAAVWQVNDCGLPRHEAGERADFVEIDVRMIT